LPVERDNVCILGSVATQLASRIRRGDFFVQFGERQDDAQRDRRVWPDFHTVSQCLETVPLHFHLIVARRYARELEAPSQIGHRGWFVLEATSVKSHVRAHDSRIALIKHYAGNA
jgi:hypothetical protein